MLWRRWRFYLLWRFLDDNQTLFGLHFFKISILQFSIVDSCENKTVFSQKEVLLGHREGCFAPFKKGRGAGLILDWVLFDSEFYVNDCGWTHLHMSALVILHF